MTLGAAIRVIEGPLAPLPCASETAYGPCGDVRACGTRLAMREVRDAVARILDRTTLADVCRRVDGLREGIAEEAPIEARGVL